MAIMARTFSGRDPFECISVTQKSIRRGDEKLACHYAYELGRSSKPYRTMIINYLRQVILFEDIGPFDPAAAMYSMLALNQAADSATRPDADEPKKERWSLPMISAIIAMARCRKSRVGNHLWANIYTEPLPAVPDFCKDMHTTEGKKMGRGIDHFLANLAMHNEVPANSATQTDPWVGRALEVWRAGLNDKPSPPPAPSDDIGIRQDESPPERENLVGGGTRYTPNIPAAKGKPKAPAPQPDGLFDTHEPGVDAQG